jgi:hypothetical protein
VGKRVGKRVGKIVIGMRTYLKGKVGIVLQLDEECVQFDGEKNRCE